jgi:hypothetical protein
MNKKKAAGTKFEGHGTAGKSPSGAKQTSNKGTRVGAWSRRWRRLLLVISLFAALIAAIAGIISIVKDGPGVIQGLKRSLIGVEQPVPPGPPPPSLPPLPEGLILFEPNEWYEKAQAGRKEVLQKRPAKLRAELRKVGMGIPNAEVEQILTYRKPDNDVLDVNYTALQGKEIAVHYLIVEPAGVPLDGYEDGYVFLRMKRIPGKGIQSGEQSPATFRLDLNQAGDWFQGRTEPSSFRVEPNVASGWWDVRIPVRPYWNDMKAKRGGSEGPTLNQLQLVFGDMHHSPPVGHYWLSTIRLVKATKK